MAVEKDIAGLEFDWLAVDAEGCVALLSTAGGGYAPPPFLQDTEAYNSAIDAILALPCRTGPRCELELRPGLTNTWKQMAERGIFAFDSDLHGGPYRVIAVPETPMRVTELPSAVALLVNRIVYPGLHFRASAELTEQQLRDYHSKSD